MLRLTWKSISLQGGRRLSGISTSTPPTLIDSTGLALDVSKSSAASTTLQIATKQQTKTIINPYLVDAPIRAFFEPYTNVLRDANKPKKIYTGRPWFASELRLKSFDDLHKLHFVLLQERNKLLSEKVRAQTRGLLWASPNRLKKVRQSMARLQTVLGERTRDYREEMRNTPKPPKTVEELESIEKFTKMKKRYPRARGRVNRKQPEGFPKAAGGLETKRRMKYIKKLQEEELHKTYYECLTEDNKEEFDEIGRFRQKKKWIQKYLESPQEPDFEEEAILLGKRYLPISYKDGKKPEWFNKLTLGTKAKTVIQESVERKRNQKLRTERAQNKTHVKHMSRFDETKKQ